MRLTGLIIVFAALLVPVPWFWALAGQHDAAAMLSQYFGSAALIAMGLSQLMATRWHGLEIIFGSLDRIYVLHKWLGIGAMALVLLHDTIDAEVNGLGRETWLNDLAETLGEISLYGLLILVVLSIATFVPYHLWKYTHKVMGAFFAASAFHYAFIMRPFDLSEPVGLYVLAFCIIGIIAYLYTLLPFGVLQGRSKYVVEAVERTGDALAITLAARGRGISHQAGQFGFVNFDVAGLEEVHPFTISSAPNADSLRFTIKRLGDYTARLERDLKVGVEAKVSGGFGHFRHRKSGAADIWIAGGIGITPFAAFAQALSLTSDKPVHLFHCVQNESQAAHKDELEELAVRNANFSYSVIESSKRQRLSADEIIKLVNLPVDQMRVYFCGPEAMRDAMLRGFKRQGLRSAYFYFEEFEIRSGIGLRKVLYWLLPRLRKGVAKGMAKTAIKASRNSS